MDLTFLRILWSRKEIKIIFITTVTGGVLQIICRRYIKNHPEFFEEKNGNIKEIEPGITNKNKNRNPRFRNFLPRGGSVITLSEIKVIAKAVMTFLAENGFLAGLGTGSTIVLSKIPTNAISTYLRDSFPQNLPELERKKFILVAEEKIYLDQCDQGLEYLFTILKDTKLSYEEKEKLTISILTKYLNLKTADGRLNFVVCIVFIFSIFSMGNIPSYHLLLTNLIEAIKEGRIPKIVGRAIIRKLKKRGLYINPELLKVVNF
jgi:hypothetical protein